MESTVNMLPNLHSAAVSDKDYFDGKVIDYSRPLKEYPTANDIALFLMDGTAPQHVYTESLNINGKVVQDEMEKYLANDGLSSSMLKAALKTPLHFEFAKSEDKELLEEIKGTPKCFNLGTFMHQCLLEPTKFSRAIVEPSIDRRNNEGMAPGIAFYEKIINDRGTGIILHENENNEFTPTEADAHIVFEVIKERIAAAGFSPDKVNYTKKYLECLIEAADVEPVTEENFIKINILKRHVDHYGGGIIKRLLTHSKREISVYHTDPETGLRLKVRPDALQFEENIGVNAIISVKTSACEDLQAFYAQSAKMHYDLSEGMYQEVVSAATGRDFNTTITIMLQTVAPYAIAVLVWSAEDIEMGKHKFRYALQNVTEIMEKGSTKSYDVFSEDGHFGLIQMALPGWNQREKLPQNI